MIGWRTTEKMKKQHLFRFDYNGVPYIHCRADTYNSVSSTGTVFTRDTIGVVDKLMEDDSKPKCKKCEKEFNRIKNIESSLNRIKRKRDSL